MQTVPFDRPLCEAAAERAACDGACVACNAATAPGAVTNAPINPIAATKATRAPTRFGAGQRNSRLIGSSFLTESRARPPRNASPGRVGSPKPGALPPYRVHFRRRLPQPALGADYVPGSG